MKCNKSELKSGLFHTKKHIVTSSTWLCMHLNIVLNAKVHSVFRCLWCSTNPICFNCIKRELPFVFHWSNKITCKRLMTAFKMSWSLTVNVCWNKMSHNVVILFSGVVIFQSSWSHLLMSKEWRHCFDCGHLWFKQLCLWLFIHHIMFYFLTAWKKELEQETLLLCASSMQNARFNSLTQTLCAFFTRCASVWLFSFFLPILYHLNKRLQTPSTSMRFPQRLRWNLDR